MTENDLIEAYKNDILRGKEVMKFMDEGLGDKLLSEMEDRAFLVLMSVKPWRPFRLAAARSSFAAIRQMRKSISLVVQNHQSSEKALTALVKGNLK